MSLGRDGDSSGQLVIRPHINIYSSCPPEAQASHPAGSLLVEPDLHGSAQKLLDFLVREGVLDVELEDQQTLLQIYKRSKKLSLEDLRRYKACLSRVFLKSFHLGILFIGDDLFDRGNSDDLTIIFYDVLREIKLLLRILISNHVNWFLKQYVAGLAALPVACVGEFRCYGESFYSLRNDILNGLVSIEEIESILRRSYFPNLLLLSCHVVSDNKIRLYSHAPSTPTKLKELGSLFNVEMQMNTVHELAASIQKLNSAFQHVLRTKESLKTFLDSLAPGLGRAEIWEDFLNDRYSQLKLDKTRLNFEVENVHGHVGAESLPSYQIVPGWEYVNLDSNLGAPFLGRDNEVGTYKFYCSSEPQFLARLREECGNPDIEAINVARREQRLAFRARETELMVQMLDVIEKYIRTKTWTVIRLFETEQVNLTTGTNTSEKDLPLNLQLQLEQIAIFKSGEDKSYGKAKEALSQLFLIAEMGASASALGDDVVSYFCLLLEFKDAFDAGVLPELAAFQAKFGMMVHETKSALSADIKR